MTRDELIDAVGQKHLIPIYHAIYHDGAGALEKQTEGLANARHMATLWFEDGNALPAANDDFREPSGPAPKDLPRYKAVDEIMAQAEKKYMAIFLQVYPVDAEHFLEQMHACIRHTEVLNFEAREDTSGLLGRLFSGTPKR